MIMRNSALLALATVAVLSGCSAKPADTASTSPTPVAIEAKTSESPVAIKAQPSGAVAVPAPDADSPSGSPEAVGVPADAMPSGSPVAVAPGKNPSTYTLADVEKHATKDDCWTVVEGTVYDVTSFIAKHPGGADKIEGMCGKEATKQFLSQHESDDKALERLKSLAIGKLSK